MGVCGVCVCQPVFDSNSPHLVAVCAPVSAEPGPALAPRCQWNSLWCTLSKKATSVYSLPKCQKHHHHSWRALCGKGSGDLNPNGESTNALNAVPLWRAVNDGGSLLSRKGVLLKALSRLKALTLEIHFDKSGANLFR